MIRLIWITLAACALLFMCGAAYAAPSFLSLFQPQKVTYVRHAAHHHHRVASHRSVRRVEPSVSGVSDSSVVETARSQIGNGPVYGRRNLWCARFVNWVLAHTGYHGTDSDLARSFASLPHTDMHVGAIAVMGRRGGGHVGIVSGVASSGDPIIISGNHAGRVREAVYPRRRIHEFVVPR